MTAFWTGCKWSSWRRLELATSDWQQNLIGLEIWEDSCLRNLEQLFWHAVLLLYLPQFLTYLLNNAFWNPDFIIVLVVRWKHTALHKATLHALRFYWVILGQTLVSCFYLLNIRGKLLQQRSESLTSMILSQCRPSWANRYQKNCHLKQSPKLRCGRWSTLDAGKWNSTGQTRKCLHLSSPVSHLFSAYDVSSQTHCVEQAHCKYYCRLTRYQCLIRSLSALRTVRLLWSQWHVFMRRISIFVDRWPFVHKSANFFP